MSDLPNRDNPTKRKLHVVFFVGTCFFVMASALSVDFYAEISAMEVFFRDWGIDGSEDSFAVAAREELDKARQLLREERTEVNIFF